MPMNIGGGDILNQLSEVWKREVAAGQKLEKKIAITQASSREGVIEALEEAINPNAARLAQKAKTLSSRRSTVKKKKEVQKAFGTIPIEALKKTAENFNRRNPELRSESLILLRQYIKNDDKAEDILKKVLEFYPDVSNAADALDFLLNTSVDPLRQEVQKAKDDFLQRFNREISAGRNISNEARAAAEKGLGTPTSLRDLYRNVTGTPKDSSTLYHELAQRYAFKDMNKVITFLLHSLGSDMNSKGPSIEPALLQRLFSETRQLQAILGVYRFYRVRMKLMQRMFQKEGMEIPPQLNFELMTQQFMALAAERYPTANKVLDTASRLGLGNSIPAKIIAISQFRDGVREVAMTQIYRSIQHRDELFMAIIECLEDLEDELEELNENEERAQGA